MGCSSGLLVGGGKSVELLVEFRGGLKSRYRSAETESTVDLLPYLFSCNLFTTMASNVILIVLLTHLHEG